MRTALICLALLGTRADGALDVRRFGARGDGFVKDTAAIQSALDAAASAGGGTVIVPAGRYPCGTLHLRSGVGLRLGPGAILLASRDEADFDRYEKLPYDPHADKETSFFHYALLAGEDIHDAAVFGEGVIDGNRTRRGGPKPVALKNCRRVSVSGVTIRNAPNYAVSMLGCDNVDVHGVTIRNGFSDGIDPDCSRFVRISNCFIESVDDAICLKASPALGSRRPTENVSITNCVLRTASINIKLGTESYGDFRDIAIANCTMIGGAGFRHGNPGLALETVDGGSIQRLVASNIVMQGIGVPVFLRLGGRGRGPDAPGAGTLEDVIISNIVATGARLPSPIVGLPRHPVRRVTLDNLRITVEGGQPAAVASAVPELPAAYPDPTMFGILPAHGFYFRHVEGLTLRNVRVDLRQPDARPPVVYDDVADLDPGTFGLPDPLRRKGAARRR